MKSPLLALFALTLLAAPIAAQKGSYSLFGSGCNQATFVNQGVPTIGQSHQLVLGAKVKPPRHPIGVLNFGVSDKLYGGTIPLPVDLTALGGKGCSIYISTELSIAPLPTSATGLTVTVPVPNDRSLIGAIYFNQFIFFSPLEPGLPFSLSNAGKAVIGG